MVFKVFSRLDFLLFCLRLTENQNRENQTRFFSLLRTTELPLESLNRTRRNFCNFDLFRDFSFSFLFALVSRPHLQARKPPPITQQEVGTGGCKWRTCGKHMQISGGCRDVWMGVACVGDEI